MSKKVAKTIGNSIEKYVHAYANNFTGAWRTYMRVRVSIDTRLPLRKEMNMRMQGR